MKYFIMSFIQKIAKKIRKFFKEEPAQEVKLGEAPRTLLKIHELLLYEEKQQA